MKTGFFDRTVDRGPYLLVGVVLFAVKHNLDRMIASVYFNRTWSPFNYFSPGAGTNVTGLSEEAIRFYGALLLAAVPFIIVGVLMTLWRLHDIGLPTWLVVFFFAPFVNLLFFIILAILPSKRAPLTSVVIEPPSARPTNSRWTRIVPDHPLGSAAMSLLVVVPLGVAGTLCSVSVLGEYGWGLFVGLPFALGLISVLLYGLHRPRSFGACLAVSQLAALLLGGALLAFAVEGAICLVMAAPLACILSGIGGMVGYLIQLSPGYRGMPPVVIGLILTMPLLMGAERAYAPPPPLLAVRSSVIVNAPPQRVWKHVVSFSELPPPTETLFRLGIAYPVRAEIHGRGVGAVRRCNFSTGPFVEPIQVWDEPRLLKFSVTSNPPPMQEWTPYGRVYPPHLKGFLVSNGGQFLLTPLKGNRTRLEGTTWYRHSMWPASYWQRWSDAIIHRIHLRVLRHVKLLAERIEDRG